MLETIREYAREQLAASGEADEAQRRHAARLGGAGMAESLARLAPDLPNLRAALAWTLERGEAEAVLRVAAALYPFWNFRGHLREGRRWLEEAMATRSAMVTTSIDGLLACAGLAAHQGDTPAARALGEEALTLAQSPDYAFGEARARYLLGIGAEWEGEVDRAASLYRESLRLWQVIAEPHWAARSLASLADVVYLLGDLDKAEALAREALALARAAGHAWTEALALGVLTHIAVDRAEYVTARQLCKETLAVSQTLGDQRGIAGVLGSLAGLLLAANRPRQATRLLAAARALANSIGLVHVAHTVSYARTLEAAQRRLGEQAFSAAWEPGLALATADAFVEAFAEAARITRGPAAAGKTDAELTPREEQVLRLLAAGYTHKEIGDELFVSHRTIDAHVAHIFAKLGIHSRAEVAVAAVRLGYAPTPTKE
jgi:DNA-binding CsgD family transcriptional regulator